MDKMGPSLILSIMHTITIETMLNLNDGNNRHWVNRPSNRCRAQIFVQFCGIWTLKIQAVFINMTETID